MRELAESMKCGGFIVSHVFQVGLQSIIYNLPADSKKVIMPVKFSVRVAPYSVFFALAPLLDGNFIIRSIFVYLFFTSQVTTDDMEYKRDYCQV